MYIRINSDKSGRLYLEQYLTLSESKDGVTKTPIAKWEKVPTIGVDGMETYALPIGQSCGVMIFPKKETKFDIGKGQIEIENTFIVSALDIYRIQDDGDYQTKIFTREKDSFIIKMPQYRFVEILMKLLTEFTVLKFNLNGQLINKQGE